MDNNFFWALLKQMITINLLIIPHCISYEAFNNSGLTAKMSLRIPVLKAFEGNNQQKATIMCIYLYKRKSILVCE